jgi:hypothetical protein
MLRESLKLLTRLINIGINNSQPEHNMELLQELLQLNEAKPRRGWDGKIKRIDDLLSWMYDKDILTNTEKKRKDTVINQYYRWYNDGDLPAAIRVKGISKWNEKKVEEELEKYLEDFIKKLLSKYFSKVDRREFRLDKTISDLKTVSDVAKSHDAHGLLTYWLKNTKINDDEGVLVDLTTKLEGQYNKLKTALDKVDPSSKSYVTSHRKEEMTKAGKWTDTFEKNYAEMTKTIDEMKTFIDDLIEGLKKLKKSAIVSDGKIETPDK